MIIKVNYTRSRAKIKASIRYIAHRPTRAGERPTRVLFGENGVIDKRQAYRMIEDAPRGTVFFRLAISPDPKREDVKRDLDLRNITRKTILALEERLNRRIQFIAAEHNDHSPNRHVHAIVMVRLNRGERLKAQDYKLLREAAAASALFQRRALDLVEAREASQPQLTRPLYLSAPYYPLTVKSGSRRSGAREIRARGTAHFQPPRFSCPECGFTQPMVLLRSGIHWCPACHLKLNQNREKIQQIRIQQLQL